MAKYLVTGGAGFIGSAAVKRLLEEGHSVVVVDNLSNGVKELVDEKAIFFQGDLTDKEFVRKVFSEHLFDAVMHFASYKAAGESMGYPEKYSDNIVGLINVLNYMVEFGVKKIIFSSSAAVYGEPKYVPLDEDHPTEPINYYGFTKLVGEKIIDWYSKLKGIVGIKLRYFNVIGSAQENSQDIYSVLVNVAEGKREKFTIFGNDYDTRDGTCVRDYVLLNDLVEAHISALKLDKSETINLGTGKGITVLELIKIVEEEYGEKINYEFGPRREGDIITSVASYDKAKELLGWEVEK